MAPEIFTNLRNILAKLYQDELSIRRIIADVGIDSARLILSSSAINNWHSVLTEAEKTNQVTTLLRVVEREYGVNQEFRRACEAYYQSIREIVPNPSDGQSSESDRYHTALRRAYLSHLYQTVEFSGAASQLDSDKPTLTLDQIFIPLLTTELGPNEEGSRGSKQSTACPQSQDSKSVSAVEQLDRHSRLALLGEPGSGKSSFVNQVALCLAGELLGDRPVNLQRLTEVVEPYNRRKNEQWHKLNFDSLIPVRIVLRKFAAMGLAEGGPGTAAHLWQYICAELAAAQLSDFTDFLHKELLENGGLILLDGLDEVSATNQCRERVKATIEDFTGVFNKCRFLLTSRVYAYQPMNSFTSVMLARFDAKQITAFIERWHACTAPFYGLSASAAKERGAQVRQILFQNEGVAELAKQPLLLSLMVSLNLSRSDSLPVTREQLYEKSIELRLDRWERQRAVQPESSQVEYFKLDKERILAALSEVAFHAHSSNPKPGHCTQIRRADLLESLVIANASQAFKPLDLVEYLIGYGGILVAQGEGLFTFAHRTFQEYFAACHLSNLNDPAKIAELARSDPHRWREVLLLAGAKLCRTGEARIWELVDALCYLEPQAAEYTEQDAWGTQLAGQTLVENMACLQDRPHYQHKINRIRCGLLAIVEGQRFSAVERAAAGRTLAVLDDRWAEAMPIEQLQFCYIPAGPCYLSDGNDSQITLLVDGYCISRYPLTNAQYAHFVKDDGYRVAAFWPEAIEHGYWSQGQFKGPCDNTARTGPVVYEAPYKLSNHPVVGVTWFEARAFCRWLTMRLRTTHALSAAWEIRLPTAWEWEKAARGGVEIPVAPIYVTGNQLAQPFQPTLQVNSCPHRRYPWGDEADSTRSNCAEEGIGTTSPGGCFRAGASPYGVEELSGNVWEWTMDTQGKQWRLIKGRAYHFGISDLTLDPRTWVVPFRRNHLIGFRVIAGPITGPV